MLNKTVCEFGWLVLVLNEPFSCPTSYRRK